MDLLIFLLKVESRSGQRLGNISQRDPRCSGWWRARRGVQCTRLHGGFLWTGTVVTLSFKWTSEGIFDSSHVLTCAVMMFLIVKPFPAMDLFTFLTALVFVLKELAHNWKLYGTIYDLNIFLWFPPHFKILQWFIAYRPILAQSDDERAQMKMILVISF